MKNFLFCGLLSKQIISKSKPRKDNSPEHMKSIFTWVGCALGSLTIDWVWIEFKIWSNLWFDWKRSPEKEII